MEITPEIIQKLNSVFNEQTWEYQYSRNLCTLAEHTTDINEQAIFQLLAKVMLLPYHENQKNPFSIRDDTCYMTGAFNISSFTDMDWSNLQNMVDKLNYPILTARIADLLWSTKKNYNYTKIAIEAYKQCAEAIFDKENWVKYFKCIKKANNIALWLGVNHEYLKELCTYIDGMIKGIDGTDTLYISISLIELMIDNRAANLQCYIAIIDKIIENSRQTSVAGYSYGRAERAFELKIKLLTKFKDNEGVLSAYADYAAYMENLARGCFKEHSPDRIGTDEMRATHLLGEAVLLYQKAKKPEDVKRLRLELIPLQKKSLEYMGTISTPIDLKGHYEEAENLFKDRTLAEKILLFSDVVFFPTKQELENMVLKNIQQFPMTQLFTSTFLNDEGKIVAQLPPLDWKNPKSNIKLFEQHLHREAFKTQKLSGIFLLPYLHTIQKKYANITANDLNFLVDDNLFIPPHRKDIFKKGLASGLDGDLAIALRVLMPEIENYFRELVKLCGGLTTKFNEDGSEEWLSMGTIFNSPELVECYDENILFLFKGLLTEDTGANLRNKVAHGMLDISEENGAVSFYFLVAIIKLCSWYSNNCAAIRMKLGKQEVI